MVLSLAMLAVAACATSSRAPDPQRLAEYRAQWNHHEGANPPEHSAEAFQQRLQLIHSPLFAALSADEQHRHLLQAVLLGWRSEQDAAALGLAQRMSKMEPIRVQDWIIRFESAYGAWDYKDAIYTLTQAARRWPGALDRFPGVLVQSVARRPARNAAERQARFELLQALYFANWVDENGVPPAELWGELALELTENRQLALGLEVARRVDSPRFVVAARTDRRFDALVSQGGYAFDIDWAADRQVDDWSRAVRRNPRRLESVVQLAYALLDVGRYEDAYRVTSSVMARMAKAASFSDLYDDNDPWFNWILTGYSASLLGLGRWTDAEGELRSAADRLEYGHRNQRNIITLARFEADMGRGREALTVLTESPADSTMAPVWRMRWWFTRLMAAVSIGDRKLEAQCLEFIRAHSKDAPSAYYESALAMTGRIEKAARLLIRRLQDPLTRRDALADVQNYHDPPMPPFVEAQNDRWNKLLKRADVQAAIARVGRVLDVPLPSAGG